MGLFGRLLDRWSKKDRDEREKERVEAKRQKHLKEQAEKKREEILWKKRAGRLQLEDWKMAVLEADNKSKKKKLDDQLDS